MENFRADETIDGPLSSHVADTEYPLHEGVVDYRLCYQSVEEAPHNRFTTRDHAGAEPVSHIGEFVDQHPSVGYSGERRGIQTADDRFHIALPISVETGIVRRSIGQ